MSLLKKSWEFKKASRFTKNYGFISIEKTVTSVLASLRFLIKRPNCKFGSWLRVDTRLKFSTQFAHYAHAGLNKNSQSWPKTIMAWKGTPYRSKITQI